jgi:rhamnosyltransferase
MSLSHEETAAVVVGYNPNQTVIINLLNVLSLQVGKIILVDNGGCVNLIDFDNFETNKIEYINFGENRGLGAALNCGFQIALKLGYKFVAMFDQDSNPEPHHVHKLISAHQVLTDMGINCAAIGPIFFDRRENVKVYFPFYHEEENKIIKYKSWNSSERLVPVDTLITSGMLVKIKVWEDGFIFNEWLFVDQTDNEWCFRVRKSGYLLFGCMDVEMGHALSDSTPIRKFGFSFFRYSPIRRYYYYRSTMYLICLHTTSIRWKWRLIVGLIIRFPMNVIIDNWKFESLKMMLKGILDGLRESVKSSNRFDC